MNHSSIDIHARGCEPTARYFRPGASREFVALTFEGAGGDLIRWEDGSVVVRVDAARRNTGKVFLSPAEARQLAERILAALPDEAAQVAA